MAEHSHPLSSIHRSFVVEFRREGDGGVLAGRVEHVTSARATRFSSAKDLLAFFQRVLGEIESAAPDPTGEEPEGKAR